MSVTGEIITVSRELDQCGLVWHPEVGDEIVDRISLEKISILVDSEGQTPNQLRTRFLWLPKVEQLVEQFEMRQAVIQHAGLKLDDSVAYQIVVLAPCGIIEVREMNFRIAFGKAMRELLLGSSSKPLH